MFSREDVAAFVNGNFEPAWQSVRPAPIVRIDFGNGNALTRTLHGNIATYVCLPDGQVLDILPGVYTPAMYLERLKQCTLLAEYVALKQDEDRQARIKEYHARQAERLAQAQEPDALVERVERGASILAVEKSVKVVLVPAERAKAQQAQQPAPAKEEPPKLDGNELANWKLLAEDTRINESLRRQQIHEILASLGVVRPAELTKRLYKEVLRTDLDDPYLGLGNVLFQTYPFSKEEKDK